MITVETITVEAITVEMVAVEAIGGVNQQLLFRQSLLR